MKVDVGKSEEIAVTVSPQTITATSADKDSSKRLLGNGINDKNNVSRGTSSGVARTNGCSGNKSVGQCVESSVPSSGACTSVSIVNMANRSLRALLRRHWAPLALMWLAQVSIGATNALPGSCLLMLASRVGATLSAMGLWFTVKSAAACLLAVLTGCLFPRLGDRSWSSWRQQPGFLLAANLTCACATVALPLVRSLWAAMSLAGVLGAGQSAVETANGILAILLFGSQHSRPILQSIHLAVAVGALTAPTLLHPFSRDQAPGTNGTLLTHRHGDLRLCLAASDPTVNISGNNDIIGVKGQGSNASHQTKAADSATSAAFLHPPLFGPFSVVCTAQMLVAVGFLVLTVRGRGLLRPQLLRNAAEPQQTEVITRELMEMMVSQNHPASSKPALAVWRQRLIIGLTVAFYFCFAGVENVFWSFIGTYGVCSPALRLPALNTAFFAGFLSGRCLGVAAAHWARPAVILGADLAGCLASLTCLCLASASPWLTILATAAFGLSVSTMYASGISWLEERLDAAGPLACSWIIGSQLGVSALSALAGHLLLSPLGPAGVMYLALAGFCSATACFLAMLAAANLRW